MKQTQDFSVLCSSFFGLVFFVGFFVGFVCVFGFWGFFARESEGWSAAATLWARFFSRIVFHLD